MLSLNPARQLLLKSNYPRMINTDLQGSDVAGASYTFNNVNIGPLGSTFPTTGIGVNFNVQRTPSNKMMVIIVHTEAAAVTWTITSCTLGGVAGGKVVDRGGATNAINTAIFQWDNSTLQGIADTNVVVTPSKAITSCAIGVCYVENFYFANTTSPASASGTSTAATNVGSVLNTDIPTLNFGVITGSTCATGGGTETAIWGVSTGTTNGVFAPTMIYEGFTTNMAYSAAFQLAPGYCANQGANMRLDWSGAGAFDFATSAFR